jgi:hypothetical protein
MNRWNLRSFAPGASLPVSLVSGALAALSPAVAVACALAAVFMLLALGTAAGVLPGACAAAGASGGVEAELDLTEPVIVILEEPEEPN